jgi:hypothetical protein
MSTAKKTLKLPFLLLNRAKALEFARLQTLNTTVANAILAMPKAQRRDLTSKSFAHIPIGSAWINQTIRNANARTKVKQFQCLPLETNNQNWTLHKVGETFSVAFGLLRGIKKRVPLASASRCPQRVAERRARRQSEGWVDQALAIPKRHLVCLPLCIDGRSRYARDRLLDRHRPGTKRASDCRNA